MHVGDQRKLSLLSPHVTLSPFVFFSDSRIEILALKYFIIIKPLYVWANLGGTGLLQS